MIVSFTVPLEIPSWNEVMRWHYHKRNNVKNEWHKATNVSINSQLSAAEKDYLTNLISVLSLSKTRSKEDLSRMTAQDLLARSTFARKNAKKVKSRKR